MKFDGKTISLEVAEMVEAMSHEQKRDLAASLVWDPDVLHDFMDALFGKYASPSWDTHIHAMRLEMLDRFDEAARNVIGALMNEVAGAKIEENRMTRWAWLLWRSHERLRDGDRTCPDCGNWVPSPAIPDFKPSSFPTEGEIDARLRVSDGGRE